MQADVYHHLCSNQVNLWHSSRIHTQNGKCIHKVLAELGTARRREYFSHARDNKHRSKSGIAAAVCSAVNQLQMSAEPASSDNGSMSHARTLDANMSTAGTADTFSEDASPHDQPTKSQRSRQPNDATPERFASAKQNAHLTGKRLDDAVETQVSNTCAPAGVQRTRSRKLESFQQYSRSSQPYQLPPSDQRQTSRTGRSGSVSPAALTSEVKRCRTWQQLQQVYNTHTEQYDAKHVCATITHLAQLMNKKRHQQESDGEVTVQQVMSDSAAVTSGTSTAPISGSHSQDRAVSHLQQTQGPPNLGFAATPLLSSSQPYASIVAALLGHLQQLHESPLLHGGREAANVVWAMSVLGCNPKHPLVQTNVIWAGRRVAYMNAQELSSFLYGRAMMKLPVYGSARKKLYMALSQHVQSCSPQAVCNVTWACSRLKLVDMPATLKRSLLQASYTQLYDMTPQGLVMMCHGLAELWIPIRGKWRDRLLDAAWRHMTCMPAAQHTVAASTIDTDQGRRIKAVSGAAQQPRQEDMFHQQRTSKGHTHFTGSGLVQLAYALARDDVHMPQEWRAVFLLQVTPHVALLTSQEAANLLWALVRMQIRPPVELLDQILSSVARALQSEPAGTGVGVLVSTVAYCLAQLQVVPSRSFTDLMLKAAFKSRQDLPARAAVAILMSLHRLGLKTNAKFTHSLLDACREELNTKGTWKDLYQMCTVLPNLPYAPPAWVPATLEKSYAKHVHVLHQQQRDVILQGMEALGVTTRNIEQGLNGND